MPPKFSNIQVTFSCDVHLHSHIPVRIEWVVRDSQSKTECCTHNTTLSNSMELWMREWYIQEMWRWFWNWTMDQSSALMWWMLTPAVLWHSPEISTTSLSPSPMTLALLWTVQVLIVSVFYKLATSLSTNYIPHSGSASCIRANFLHAKHSIFVYRHREKKQTVSRDQVSSSGNIRNQSSGWRRVWYPA